MGLITNIYERNGYTFHSFGDQTIEPHFEIPYILTNLDTRILRFFVEFIQNSKLKKENISTVAEHTILENNAYEKLDEEHSKL